MSTRSLVQCRWCGVAQASRGDLDCAQVAGGVQRRVLSAQCAGWGTGVGGAHVMRSNPSTHDLQSRCSAMAALLAGWGLAVQRAGAVL